MNQVTTNNMNCLFCYNTKIYNNTNTSIYDTKIERESRRDKILQYINFFLKIKKSSLGI